MSPEIVIPEIEGIVCSYLTGVAEIKDLIADRVATETPPDVGAPWVRVVLIAAPSIGSTDHFVQWNLQLDVFAGQNSAGQVGDAADLTLLVRGAMAEIHKHDHGEATFSGAEVTHRPMPKDTDFEKPMVRYMVSATVWGHG